MATRTLGNHFCNMLSGLTQEAVDILPMIDACDCYRVRGLILRTLELLRGDLLRRRELEFPRVTSPWIIVNKIKSNCLLWLKPEKLTKELLVELIMMEQFVLGLPGSAKKWVLCHEPRNLDEAVHLMETFESSSKTGFLARSSGGQCRVKSKACPIQVKEFKVAVRVRDTSSQGVEEEQATTENGQTPNIAGETFLHDSYILRTLGLRKPPIAPRELGGNIISCFQCGEKGHFKRECSMMDCSMMVASQVRSIKGG